MRQNISLLERIMLAGVILAGTLLAEEGHSKADVFGGYQYLRVGTAPGLAANGWNAAITGNVNRWFGITGDLSGAYRPVGGINLSAHTFTVGPQFALHGRRVTPFAHVLLGAFRALIGTPVLDTGLDGFAMMTGGGVDINVSDHIAVRPFQLDWVLWHTSGTMEKKNARISAGIVFRIN
jgi:hypothetical protein